MSGARIAAYDDVRLDGNDLRIRYSDLASAWDQTIASGGFQPTHVVAPALPPPRAGEVVAEGRFEDERWVLVEPP